ncbi:MAG: TraI domain-containing protein [Geminicoccales bacterium]
MTLASITQALRRDAHRNSTSFKSINVRRRADYPCANRLKYIAQLVGLPPTHFKLLYQDLVDNLAGHILSCTTACDHSDHLDHLLYVSERALTIRQCYLLPENTPPEEIARRSDHWTYGVFLAALFHDLRSLAAASSESSSVDLEALAQSLVPDIGLQWLSSEPDLVTSWLAVVDGDLVRAGVLGAIVGQVVESMADKDVSHRAGDDDLFTTGEKTEMDKSSAALDLAKGIGELVVSGRLKINVAEEAWVTATDLWISLRGGLDVIRQWVAENTASFPLKNNELLDLFQESKICKVHPQKQQAVWPMCVKQGLEQKKILLVRMPIEIIWPDPSDYPPLFEGQITSRKQTSAALSGDQARLPFA